MAEATKSSLTRESLDRLKVSLGGAPVELGCTSHPDHGVTAVYDDGHVRILCRGCGFEKARIKVALRDPVAGEQSIQDDVADFFRALDLPIGETPAIRDPQINADLILEEARETAEAITGRRVAIEFDDNQVAEREQSLVGAIDGMCDQLATIFGAAITFGVDLAPFWAEVHRTNLAKAGGPKRGDGKVLKPEGWTPPNLEPILAEQEGRP